MLQFCEEARNSLRRQVAATLGRSLVSSGRQPLVLLQIKISIYSANVFGQSETLSRGKLQLPSADPSLRSRNKAGQAETADFFASDRNQHSLLKVFQMSEPSLGASCSYCQADPSRASRKKAGQAGRQPLFWLQIKIIIYWLKCFSDCRISVNACLLLLPGQSPPPFNTLRHTLKD
jgi:hypothetical protein